MQPMLESDLESCPAAPQARASVHTRVLHRACQKLGGLEPLARRLDVPTAVLYGWLAGESTPPTSVFLQAVDIVMPVWTEEDEALSRELLDSRPKPGKKR